jgi:hypothetical protein
VFGNQMNKEKIKLIVKNMELLIQSLKLELEEDSNIIGLNDLVSKISSDNINYEPDYYEEP